MGSHREGLVSIGAFVDVELRDYLDKLAAYRGLLSRSDAVRAIISEHRAVFLDRIDGSKALTPKNDVVNDIL